LLGGDGGEEKGRDEKGREEEGLILPERG